MDVRSVLEQVHISPLPDIRVMHPAKGLIIPELGSPREIHVGVPLKLLLLNP